MAAFQYQALNANGKKVKGVLEAENARHARQLLRDQGLMPLAIESAKNIQKKTAEKKTWRTAFSQQRLRATELSLLTRQLATLLSAGIPLDEALTSVAEQAEKHHVKTIILGVRAKVMEGHRLADGMNDFPKSFPRLYRVTVDSGEQSGKLDQVLNALAEYTERQHQIRQKVRQALLYPLLMLFVSLSIVIFILIYVVPRIVGVFAQTKMVLPTATTILISISHFIQQYGLYVLGILLIGILIFRRALKYEGFRSKIHRLLLKLPVLGKNMQILNCARFARTFGILSAASVPTLEAMQSAAKLIVPLPMQKAVLKAIDKVREGSNIHTALKQTNFFPPMFIHLVASGEASGRLESMLEKAAINQENDVENLIQGTLTLFEPLLILVMGGVVLFIVLAVLLPIFSLDQYGG